METGDEAIRAESLTKEYGDVTAVDRLDLSIETGSVYGFLGPNGAGKTTTMRMLTTLTKPTSGRAWIVGNPIHERRKVVQEIGYLPEEPPLYDELTGREHLEYIAGLRDMPRDESEERIEELFDRFDLLGSADKRISAYSKGMKQKTGIIQSILHNPSVVFLDEPTSGLDPRAARKVRDTISDLAEDEMTVFLSTHILPVVDELADEIGVLYEGRLVTEGSPDELKKRAEVTAQTEAEGSGSEMEERTLEDVFLEVTSDDEYY